MKANYENKVKPSTEVSLGTLYDMNKQIMESAPVLTDNQIGDLVENICSWLADETNQDKYYMMLCHERRDYTLFNLDKTNQWRKAPFYNCAQAANDVIECLQNRGDILSIEYIDATHAWELWIRNEEGCFAYYLFNYDQAVLEY